MDRVLTPLPSRSRDAAIAAAYGATLAWSLAWFALGPAERPNLFFREGGPIDLVSSVWLLSASALFGLTYLSSRGSSLRAFWLVASVGLLFLGIDERFQGHELLSEEIQAPAPLGMRNWNDVAVLSYGVVAAALVLWRLPLLWRAKRLRWLGILACGLASISTGIDSIFSSSTAKDLWEETFKILSAAGLFTVALEAFDIEARRVRTEGSTPTREGSTPTREGWGFRLAVVSVVAVVGFAILGSDLIEGALGIEDEAWSDRLSQNWGSPPSWLVCVLLWVSSILLLLAHRARPAGVPGRTSLLMSVYLAVLGIGEGLRATRFRIENRLVEDQFPATFAEELSFMHDPLQLPGILFIVSAAASSLILLRSPSPPASDPESADAPGPLQSAGFVGPSVAGLTLLAIALLANELGGSTVNFIHAPALRIAGGTLLLLAAVHQFLLVRRAPVHRS